MNYADLPTSLDFKMSKPIEMQTSIRPLSSSRRVCFFYCSLAHSLSLWSSDAFRMSLGFRETSSLCWLIFFDRGDSISTSPALDTHMSAFRLRLQPGRPATKQPCKQGKCNAATIDEHLATQEQTTCKQTHATRNNRTWHTQLQTHTHTHKD